MMCERMQKADGKFPSRKKEYPFIAYIARNKEFLSYNSGR